MTLPRFAANLTMLFTEVPFLDRFERAAQAGFKAVEFLFPYDFAAAEIRSRLDAHGLQLVLHNLPAGDWAAGERGTACHPDRVAEFRAGVARAITDAQALGVGQLNRLAGKAPAGVDDARVRSTCIANLRFAAAALKQAGLKLLIEPINNFDIPGFWLNRTALAVAVLDEVGADNPGRNEPGTGEINYAYLLPHIDKLGYQGWIGCEYKPAGKTVDGLGWTKPYLG